MNLKKKNACRSLSADVSGTSCHAHNSFAKSRSCRCVILCNFSSQTWSLLLYVSKPFTAKKKKKKTQVCLWFAACACDDRLGSLSAHLNGIMFAARSSIHILHDFSSFFFFFFFLKTILLHSLQRPHNKHLLVLLLLVIRSAAVLGVGLGAKLTALTSRW